METNKSAEDKYRALLKLIDDTVGHNLAANIEGHVEAYLRECAQLKVKEELQKLKDRLGLNYLITTTSDPERINNVNKFNNGIAKSLEIIDNHLKQL